MPTVVKVGLNPKQSIQYQEVYDFQTGFVTRTATQYWIVVFNAPVSDPSACRAARDPAGNQLPLVTQDYSTTQPGAGAVPGMFCTRVQPMLDGNSAKLAYKVQCDFSSRPQAQGQAGPKWDITIGIDGAGVTETVYSDGAGKAYVNSAGQPFQQQRQRTYFDNVYRVGFKSRTLNPSTIDPIQGCLNQGAFTLSVASLGFSKSFQAQSTLLARCPTSTVLTGDPSQPSFWQAEYELYYRKPIVTPPNTTGGTPGQMVSGWTPFILDQGFCELSGGQLKQILDANGQPLNSPQYLDGNGSKSATPHYLQFAPDQPSADFTPLFQGIA